MFVERMIQKVVPGKWQALEALDKRYDVMEARLGFPPKRRMQSILGSHPIGTLIVEREWPSLAAMEGAVMKRMADPENASLSAELDATVETTVWEVYMLLP